MLVSCIVWTCHGHSWMPYKFVAELAPDWRRNLASYDHDPFQTPIILTIRPNTRITMNRGLEDSCLFSLAQESDIHIYDTLFWAANRRHERRHVLMAGNAVAWLIVTIQIDATGYRPKLEFPNGHRQELEVAAWALDIRLEGKKINNDNWRNHAYTPFKTTLGYSCDFHW